MTCLNLVINLGCDLTTQWGILNNEAPSCAFCKKDWSCTSMFPWYCSCRWKEYRVFNITFICLWVFWSSFLAGVVEGFIPQTVLRMMVHVIILLSFKRDSHCFTWICGTSYKFLMVLLVFGGGWWPLEFNLVYGILYKTWPYELHFVLLETIVCSLLILADIFQNLQEFNT